MFKEHPYFGATEIAWFSCFFRFLGDSVGLFGRRFLLCAIEGCPS